eukprot:ctg_5792.g607
MRQQIPRRLGMIVHLAIKRLGGVAPVPKLQYALSARMLQLKAGAVVHDAVDDDQDALVALGG